METSPREAFDLLSKWKDDWTPIRVQAYFDKVAFSFEGLILEVDQLGILMRGENDTEVNLVLRDHQKTFVYTDDRHVTGKEKERFECVLGILFDTEGGQPVQKLDRVFLAVHRESNIS
jgi:hypothetical protein